MEGENLVFRLSLQDDQGKPIQLRLNANGLQNLIATLISTASRVPQEPSLQTEIELDPDPAKATAFGISPIDGNHTAARVSIAFGPVAVQFAVPLDDLYEALEALDQDTEPGSTSPHRPS